MCRKHVQATGETANNKKNNRTLSYSVKQHKNLLDESNEEKKNAKQQYK